MAIGGIVAFPAFVYWEAKTVTYQVIPVEVLKNRTVMVLASNLFWLEGNLRFRLGWIGSIAAVASQTGAQGSLPHQDVALVTAVVLLTVEPGSVVGFPGLVATTWPDLRSEPRKLMHDAFSAERDLLIPALAPAFIPVAASLFVQDFKLNKIQNTVEARDVTDELAVTESAEEVPGKRECPVALLSPLLNLATN
ncbi:uncharacterized protein EI90DRAFT_3011337 [Cantharellus anzutake]|uniref:uncharacterized protein n=1 Tax=Cantharellus anzutake TaxID=1750568 RepID=UPI001907C217|nr:uncharacterized protein EI90DRAFT_3011337 [Cantharellus anzutake]KAF8342891.1 hypothetical protein EI90DRAFT_3011337 [Cantharellus anzutake]